MSRIDILSGYSLDEIDEVVLEKDWDRYEEMRETLEYMGIETSEVENVQIYSGNGVEVMEVKAPIDVPLTDSELEDVDIEKILS